MYSLIDFGAELDTICSMTKEWKDGLRGIVIAIITTVLTTAAGLIAAAFVKGEDLKGLGKAAALAKLLKTGVPLWAFLIVMVVAILGSVRWYKARKKTLIHVEWRNDISLWCIANAGDEKWMQVMLHGFFTNSDPDVALIITSVYLEGTKPAMSLYEPLEFPPHHVSPGDVTAMVKPVLLEEGKTFAAK